MHLCNLASESFSIFSSGSGSSDVSKVLEGVAAAHVQVADYDLHISGPPFCS